MTVKRMWLLQQDHGQGWEDWDIVEMSYVKVSMLVDLAKRQGRKVRVLNEDMKVVL